MDLSVIIPVFNRAAIVETTLNTVVNQSFRPIHLILVDNNSSDNSLQVLENFKRNHEAPDFTISVLKETKPFATAARNCGLLAATTEWVMFFDSDDFMAPDLIQTYADKADDHTDIIVTKACLKESDGTIRQLPYFESDIFANHLIHTSLSTQRHIARRRVFMDAGLWDEKLSAWNDFELGVRLLLTTSRIAFIGDKARIQINSSQDSITGHDFSHKHGVWEQALDTIEQSISRSCHPQKRRLLGLVNYRRVVLAAHYIKEGHPEFAEPLYQSALQRSSHRKLQSMVLSIAYHYISHGGRGFGRIFRILF